MRGEFEKIIKDKMYQHEVAPSADLFDSIVSKGNKKKGIAWWWYTAAAVLLIGGITTVYMANRSDTPALPESNEVSEMVNPAIEADETVIPNSNNTKTAVEAVVADDQGSEVDASDAQSDAGRVTYAPNTPKTSGTTDQDASDNTQEYRELFNDIIKSTPENAGAGRLFVREHEVNVEEGGNPIVPNTQDENPGSSRQEKDAEMKDDIKANRTIADKGDSPEEKLETPDADESPVVAQSNKDDDDNMGGDDNPPLPKKWAVQVLAGPGYASRSLSGNSNHIALRNEAEAYRLSYGISLTGMYQFGDFWNVQTGIDYSVRNENFNYNQTTETITENVSTEEIVIVHPVLGTIKREVEVVTYDTATNTSTQKSNNSYTSLSIPVRVERLIPLKNNKWMAMVNTGVLIGVQHAANGMTIDANEEAVNMSEVPYKQQGINQLSFGVGAAYQLNQNVQLMIYPQGNWALNSSVENQAIKQNEFGVFTQFGLRFKF